MPIVTANGQKPPNPWAPIILVVLSLLLFVLPTFLSPRQAHVSYAPIEGTKVNDMLSTPFVGPVQPTSAATPEVSNWPHSDEADWAPNSEFTTRLQKVILVLLFMCAFIGIALRAVNKMFPGLLNKAAGGAAMPGTLMNILERQTVAPGVHLCVVEVAGKTMMLGFTEGNINQICELSPEDVQKAREAAVVPAVTVSPDQIRPAAIYGRILRQYLSIIPGMGAKRS